MLLNKLLRILNYRVEEEQQRQMLLINSGKQQWYGLKCRRGQKIRAN